ncbi:MAG: GNAT family N-acetyltransferase, partial [Nitratireductor sp.]
MRGSASAVTLRPPRPGEAGLLTTVCLRSKAHWGYDRAFMEACRAELMLAEADLDRGRLRVAQRDGAIVGVAEIALADDEASLEKLFVVPEAMGCGVGGMLLEWAMATCRHGGALRMVIEADPDAAAFYRKYGARDAGRSPSGSIPGRFL